VQGPTFLKKTSPCLLINGRILSNLPSVRHTDAYHFNNLWVKMKSTAPGDSISSSQQFDLPLASQTGWTGTGMDDIYEHRILLYRQPVKFLRQGEYSVVLEQVMRENPLEEILNVGIRLEKVKQQ
jgi:gliding motility-associated lipoprotein GldH